MAEGHHSLRRTKRGRSPSASRSERLHKCRNDEHESPKSDITPKGTPEDITIRELTVAVRDIKLEDTPRAWRHKTVRGIRRDRPRKRLFSSEEAEGEQSRRTRELPNWTVAELRCLMLFLVLHTDGKIWVDIRIFDSGTKLGFLSNNFSILRIIAQVSIILIYNETNSVCISPTQVEHAD